MTFEEWVKESTPVREDKHLTSGFEDDLTWETRDSFYIDMLDIREAFEAGTKSQIQELEE